MEDHVRGLLRPLPPLVAAAASLAAFLQALRPVAAAPEWAALAALSGALATTLAAASAPRAGRGRALALGAGIGAAALTLTLLGEAAWLVARTLLLDGSARGR